MHEEYRGQQKTMPERRSTRLPNFFIVGAAKSGTTSLYNYLNQHPDVYMSPLKEPHWFSRVSPQPSMGMYSVTSEKDYLKLFKGWQGEHAVGEASPSYLWDSQAPIRIKRSVPDAKIIILLREPISRAFSHYLMDVRDGRQELPFYEALREDYASPEKGWWISHLYVELGLYCEQVARYMDCFGQENVLVLLFEEFVSDVGSTLTQVARFLNIDPTQVSGIDYREKHNVYVIPRKGIAEFALRIPKLKRLGKRLFPEKTKHFLRDKVLFRRAQRPPIERQAANFLQRIYKPEVICLEKLINRKLPW